MNAKKNDKRHELFDELRDKSVMKSDVFDAAKESFELLKSITGLMTSAI